MLFHFYASIMADILLISFSSNYCFSCGALALAEGLYSSAKAEAPNNIQNICTCVKCILQFIDFQKKTTLMNACENILTFFIAAAVERS